MALIEVENVSKIYNSGEVKTVALNAVGLNIEEGEFVAVMGPSGSGKSTLLHILGLLDRPTSGRYKFLGKTIEDYSDDELAKIRNENIGFVFQSFNLLPRTTVFDNVKLPLLYSSVGAGDWDKLVADAIESVGLTNRRDHDPSQLSGGEKQRVAIARALVNKPSVIFADEPTGNLDSMSGQKVMEIVRGLNDGGKTIVLITHETLTAKYAKRIINMKDGSVVRSQEVVDRMAAGSGRLK